MTEIKQPTDQEAPDEPTTDQQVEQETTEQAPEQPAGQDQEQAQLPGLQRFHSDLIEDQSRGIVNGVPEDYKTFEYSFQNEEYRQRFHFYLLSEQLDGKIQGIPREVDDFTQRFAPEFMPEPDEVMTDLQSGDINSAARRSTIDMSLLDAPGLSNDMIQAMQSDEQMGDSMLNSIADASKHIRQHLKKVDQKKRGLVATNFYGITDNSESETEYVSELTDTSNALKGQLFQAYSTLKNERDRLEQKKSELEEEYTTSLSTGMSGRLTNDITRTRVPEENKDAYNKLQRQIETIDEKIDDVQPSGTDLVRHSINTFLGNYAAEIPASLFEGVAILSTATNKMLRVLGEKTNPTVGGGIETVRRLLEGKPGKYDDVSELATWQIAQSVRKVAQEQFPTDPTMQDSFLYTMVPGITASFGAYASGGLAARAIGMSSAAFATTAAGSAGMGQGYKMAKAYGASEEDAQIAAEWSFIGGALQVFPVIRVLDRYDRAVGGQLKRGLMQIVKEGAEGGLEEAFAEASGQAWFEVVADQIYREEPELLKSMGKIGEAGGAGALAGFLASILFSAAGRGAGGMQSSMTDTGTPSDGAGGGGVINPDGSTPGAGGEGGFTLKWDISKPMAEQSAEIKDQVEILEDVRDMMAEQGEETTEIDEIIKAGYNELSRLEYEQAQSQRRPEASPSIARLLTEGTVTEAQESELQKTQQAKQNVSTQGTIGQTVGDRVDYNGYTGRLEVDSEGNFVVQTDRGVTVEVVDTQKNPDLSLEEVGMERNFASMRQFRYDPAADNFVMEQPNRQTGETETGTFEYVRTNTDDAGVPVSVTMTNEAGQERTFRAPEAVEDIIWAQFFSDGTDMQALDREMRRAFGSTQQTTEQSDGDAEGSEGPVSSIPHPGVSLYDGDSRLETAFNAFDTPGPLTEQEQTDALQWANEKMNQVINTNPDNAQQLVEALEQFELEVLNYGNQQTTPDMGDGSTDGDQATVSEPTGEATNEDADINQPGQSESAGTEGSAPEGPATGQGRNQSEQEGTDGSVETGTTPDRPPNNWRNAVEETDDPFRSNDILQGIANMKSTDAELSDVLDYAEENSSNGNESANVFYDVSQNPAASEETKQRALDLYESVVAPGTITDESNQSPSTAQLEAFAEEVEQRIIRVDVGRGKTGKAKSGKPRFMFRDQDAQAKFNAKIRDVYEATDDPVAWEEFLATSTESIMNGLVVEDVGLVIAELPGFSPLYLWNDAKLRRLGPGTLQRMELQNDLRQGRDVPQELLDKYPGAVEEMGITEDNALDVMDGDYSMWLDEDGFIHFFNKIKGREVGPTSKYFNDALIEFTVRRWNMIPNKPIQEIAPQKAIEATNGNFSQLVNDHSEHLYDFVDAIQHRINEARHKDNSDPGREEITDDFLSGQITISHDDVRSFRPDAWGYFPILRMKTSRDAPTDPALIADRINDKWDMNLSESEVVDLFIQAHTGDVKTGDFTDSLTQSLSDQASQLIGREYTRKMHDQLLEAIDARRGDVTVQDVQDAQKLIDHESFDASLMFDENGSLIVDQAAQQIADLAAQDPEFEAYNQGELSPEMIQELQNENTQAIQNREPASESAAEDRPATGQNERTTPAQREVTKQIAAAQTEVQRANNARSVKIKELQKTLQDDAKDLFGKKKPTRQKGMFNSEADPDQIPVALKPFNDRLQVAQDNLQRLHDKRDSLQPEAEPDIFQQEGLEERANELRSELNELLNEYDRMSEGGLRTGIDPRLIAQSAKIIAKGLQLGFVRFQQFADYIISEYGADFWNEIFDSFKMAYMARMRKMDNPPGDLAAVRASTAEEWATTKGGSDAEATTDTGDTEATPDSEVFEGTEADPEVDPTLDPVPENGADMGYNTKDAPPGLFTVGREYTDGQIAAIKQGRFGLRDADMSFEERFKAAKYLAGLKLRQGVFDQFNSLDRILGDRKAWMMAQLTQGTTGALEAALDFGRPYLKEGAILVDINKKSFKQILSPVGKELDDWLKWVAGNRAYEIKQEDARRLNEWENTPKSERGKKPESRENLLSDENIDALRSLSDGKMDDGRSRSEVYNDALKEYDLINQAIVQIAVDTGLVNADQAADWAQQGVYVPFYRMVDSGETRGPKMFKDELSKQNAFKKLKGSDLPLDDLLGNITLNWNHLLAASMRNQAAAKALETAAEIGMAQQVVEDAATKDAIWVRVDGQKVYYEFEDSVQAQLVIESLTSINYENMNGVVMKSLRAFKRWLTIGVTTDPEFRIANLLRDTISTPAVSGLSLNIIKNLRDGWTATKPGSQTQANMIAGAGAFGDSGYIHGTDQELLRNLIKKGVDRDSILDNEFRIQKMWDKYQDFGARLENVNRAARYVKVLKEGGTHLEANFESRDVLDFSRVGAFKFVRVLSQAVPFLNARLQGGDKMYRAIEDPNQRRQFAIVTGTYTLAAIGLYLYMMNDEDYQQAEQWERDAYLMFKPPGSDIMLRFPKPFEVGAIGTMGERLTEQIVDDEVHGELFAERLGHTLGQTLSFNPIPQALMPPLEIYANKNMFTGRPIENMGMQRLSPEMRKRAWTSQTAIGMSQGLSKVAWDKVTLSPVQIEHLVNGYFGWVGGTTMAATDMLISRPLAQSAAQPSRRIGDYPVIGRFAREADNRNSKYITNFYDNLNDINQKWADIQEYRELGEITSVDDIPQKTRDILRYRKGYNRVSRRFSEINKQIESIYRDEELAPDLKRVQVDSLSRLKKELAKEVVQKSDNE